MESIFTWLSELGLEEGMKLFLIVASILALIPYYRIIFIFLRQLVLKTKFEICFFEYSIKEDIHAGRDNHGRDIFLEIGDGDKFIVGSKLKLYWKVNGAYRVDLEPVGSKLKGNCANVLINENITAYTLTAYGFFGKKETAVINIPRQKMYYLKNTKISQQSDKVIRHAPKIATLQWGNTKIGTKNIIKERLRKPKSWLRLHLLKPTNSTIHTSRLVHPNQEKIHLYNKLSRGAIVKSYNFSTKKYQDLA